MGWSDQEIKDLVEGTLNEMDPPHFIDIAQDLYAYEVMGRWLKEDRIIKDEGIGIRREIMGKYSQAASFIHPQEKDTINIEDLLTHLDVPWVHAQTYWAWTRQDMLKNRKGSKVVDLIDVRRQGAMLSLARILETAELGSAPAVGDTKNPYNLQYYIVKNATFGFQGGLPGSHTTVAGVNLTTWPNYKNHTGTYGAVTKPDLFRKLKKMARVTHFVSPIANSNALKIKDNYRYYTNGDGLDDVEEALEKQGDALGPDGAPLSGKARMNGNPFVALAELDSDSSNPFYQINHDTFYIVVLEGDYLRESEPRWGPSQHNVLVVFVDLSMNTVCVDRRRNGVLYKA